MQKRKRIKGLIETNSGEVPSGVVESSDAVDLFLIVTVMIHIQRYLLTLRSMMSLPDTTLSYCGCLHVCTLYLILLLLTFFRLWVPITTSIGELSE